jgi:hypothetical protein
MSAEETTAASRAAIRWMKDHGGDAAVVRVNGGGRYILAQGEQAPFLPSTCRALIDAGLAEYVDQNGRKSVRFRLTDAGRAA